jgi:hypothetical protein
MSEFSGNNCTESQNAYTLRKDELLRTLPWVDPTPEGVEAARLRLLQEVTFEDETQAAACDDLTVMAAWVLDNPEALWASARSEARYARAGSILAAEGLTPPVVEA